MQAKRVLTLAVVVGLAALTVSASAQVPTKPAKPAGGAQGSSFGGLSGTYSQGMGGTSASSPFGGTGMFTSRGGLYPAGPHADPLTQKLYAEEASLGQESDRLARQLFDAKTDADKDKVKARLSEALEKQFDARQKRHEAEIAGLEAQVKKLKEQVQKRQENRRDIVSRRLDQLLRDAQGLGW